MLPRLRSVTRQRLRVDLLRVVQVVQGLGKEVDGVVDQGGFSLKIHPAEKSQLCSF